MREINRRVNVKAIATMQRFDDIEAPLEPPVGREHRIQHDRAVGVRAEPIVWEDGIRFDRCVRVIENVNIDPSSS